MSRTRKDTKQHRRYDNWHCSYKPGVKKWWRRMSNKKMRQTPITKTVVDMVYTDEEVIIKIPRNIVPGSLPQQHEVKVVIPIATPTYIEVENYPTGLDIWSLD